MNVLFLDIFSGISGDMFLGAMIDLGMELPRLDGELSKLKIAGYHLHAARRQKANIEGVKFDVHLESEPARETGHEPSDPIHAQSHWLIHPADHHHHHDQPHPEAHEESHSTHKDSGHGRTFAGIRTLIAESDLSEWIKQKALAVFHRVAVAEGKIHGHTPEAVHFHEVGALDSIVDVVGACIALDLLGRPRVFAGPVVDGTGWVECAHGRFPVPTTATLEILGARGIALTQCEEPHELVTPTGAALLAELVEHFGPMQGLVARKIGYGLGSRELRSRPNVLRAVLGDVLPSPASVEAPKGDATLDWETDAVAVIETNLDDANPEVLGHFMETAFAAGALDVFHSPIHMKKNRPGVLLNVLCAVADADRFIELILRETSAFGVRRQTWERRKLQREMVRVKTVYGEVAVKLGKLNQKVLHATPEYESCKELARQTHVSLKAIYDAVPSALTSTGYDRS